MKIKPPLAEVGFYSSLSASHIPVKDRSLTALRARGRVNVGVGLVLEVDQSSLHDEPDAPWMYWNTWGVRRGIRPNYIPCGCCVKDHLRDAAKTSTKRVKEAKIGPAKWSRVAYRLHVRLFDGGGTDDDVRAAHRARRAAVRRLRALGYRVVERDDRGGKIVHAPTKRWTHAKGCDR